MFWMLEIHLPCCGCLQQDRKRQMASLVRLRSLGSLDDLTDGSLLVPDPEVLVEGLRRENSRGVVIQPRRNKKREGSLRSRCKLRGQLLDF